MGNGMKAVCSFFCKGNHITGANNICIFCIPANQFISYKTTDQVTRNAQLFRGMGDFFKNEQFSFGELDFHVANVRRGRERQSQGGLRQFGSRGSAIMINNKTITKSHDSPLLTTQLTTYHVIESS